MMICLPAGILLISIHALTRSATLPTLQLTYVASNFNPRTHKECDLNLFKRLIYLFMTFQSTHSQGVRQ